MINAPTRPPARSYIGHKTDNILTLQVGISYSLLQNTYIHITFM